LRCALLPALSPTQSLYKHAIGTDKVLSWSVKFYSAATSTTHFSSALLS